MSCGPIAMTEVLVVAVWKLDVQWYHAWLVLVPGERVCRRVPGDQRAVGRNSEPGATETGRRGAGDRGLKRLGSQLGGPCRWPLGRGHSHARGYGHGRCTVGRLAAGVAFVVAGRHERDRDDDDGRGGGNEDQPPATAARLGRCRFVVDEGHGGVPRVQNGAVSGDVEHRDGIVHAGRVRLFEHAHHLVVGDHRAPPVGASGVEIGWVCSRRYSRPRLERARCSR